MTHDRTDTIPLTGDVARCEPSGVCHVRGRCARYEASLPKYGGSMTDFSLTVAGGTALCDGYIGSATVRKAAEPPPVAKPYVRGL